MNVIAENLDVIRRRIKQLCIDAGRASDAVQLIAVSKTRALAEVTQAIRAGQSAFGENTIQDAITKIPLLEPSAYKNLDWHFIGHLQSKKSKQLVEHFQWIHTVDSLKLAQKLSLAMQQHKPDGMLNCLLQVNLSGEESKSGLTREGTMVLLDELLELNLPNLIFRGLMTIGVHGDEIETQKVFSDLRMLRDECQKKFGLKEFDQLSMGMSGDYAVAIEEGSTMVRIGSSIFGTRR